MPGWRPPGGLVAVSCIKNCVAPLVPRALVLVRDRNRPSGVSTSKADARSSARGIALGGDSEIVIEPGWKTKTAVLTSV